LEIPKEDRHYNTKEDRHYNTKEDRHYNTKEDRHIHEQSYTGFKLYHGILVCCSYVGFYVREDVKFVDKESKMSIGSRAEPDGNKSPYNVLRISYLTI
jgi:hypothetical protein